MPLPNQMPTDVQGLGALLAREGVAPMDRVMQQQQLATALAGGGSRGSSAPPPMQPQPGMVDNFLAGARTVGGGLADAGRWAMDKLTPAPAKAAPARPMPVPTSEDVNRSNEQLATIVEAYNRGDATKQQVSAALMALDRSWQQVFGQPHPNAGWMAEEVPKGAPSRAPLKVSVGQVEMPTRLTIGAPEAAGPGKAPAGPAPAPVTMSAKERRNTEMALRASREMRRRTMQPSGAEMPASRRPPKE
jgi:hypothetical protein